MSDDVHLYREPEDVLERELEHLRARLKAERAEVTRYEALRGEKDKALEELIAAAREDSEMTASLVKDYRAVLKLARGVRS